MPNVFVTNFNGHDENVMLFGDLSAEQLQAFFDIKGHSYGEVYEVPGRDLQFYIWDPVYVSESQRQNVLSTIKAHQCDHTLPIQLSNFGSKPNVSAGQASL